MPYPGHGTAATKGNFVMRAMNRFARPRFSYPSFAGHGVSRARAALMAWVLALSACTPGADLPPVPPAYSGPYLLGPGDEVRMITFGDTTLTGNFTVDESGHVALPLLGRVKAAGLTTDALQSEVIAELRDRKLFNAPSVVIEVFTRRPVFVLGEVQKPGQYPYEPGMTVLSAVAIAGGYTYRAVKRRVEIERESGSGKATGQADPGAALQPGDVVTVLERHF
jgi:polysaccharide export outer membrane protein